MIWKNCLIPVQMELMSCFFGEELLSEPLNIQKLIQQQLSLDKTRIPFAPKILKGEDIANAVDNSLMPPALAICTPKKVLRFIDLLQVLVE